MPCSLIGADNEVPHQTQTRCLNNRPTTRSGQRPSSFLSRGAGWDRCRRKTPGWSDRGKGLRVEEPCVTLQKDVPRPPPCLPFRFFW
ncbi:hypothetical protein CEXT_288171 [Caerostris extrusa]|uniref:Uncharacterized protein n=1 Tax=Caerostris extrusa TaxID=172846 RepID=A0AAV4U5W9_CAEEX|nr:hypothetical protein CEXT_288171 [Caerostris extrusa]